MRELERDLPATSEATHHATAAPTHLIVVGSGRAGGSIARAAEAGGVQVDLLGRDDEPDVSEPGTTAVLLCVPDAAIAAACARVAPVLEAETAVGHSSGATTLAALAPARERGCPVFSLHPLQTIPDPETPLAGAPCAIAGAGVGLAVARSLADAMEMRAFEVPDESRALYHAAAAIASNFLVTLEESATEALAAAGVANPREALAPLVLRTAANWADAGAEALTGPIARGDEETVAAHLRALGQRVPQLAPLYEALADRTREVAARREAAE